MKTSTAVIVIVILLAIVGIGWYYHDAMTTGTPGNATSTAPIATAAFACDMGKSIGATFYSGAAAPAPAEGQPPTPTGSVALQLSDGRSMTLAQTLSASGVRYANADESFIFWGKGNTAFVQEGADQNQTYTGCIVVSPDPTGALTQIFATSSLGISIRFPAGYTVDQNYAYQEMGPGKDIDGVKFTIPANAAAGTNLSQDTYVSVEELPKATSCTADLFVDQGSKASTFTDGGVDYSVATSSGAGAGNLYEEAVFAIPGSSPCTAVRYFIHSTQIANYPAGTVTAFDRTGLINEFDAIRRTLVLGR